MNFPGATTQSYGYDTSGDKIPLQPIDLTTPYDIDHSSNRRLLCGRGDGTGVLPARIRCKMDGWNNEKTTLHAPADAPYAYVSRKASSNRTGRSRSSTCSPTKPLLRISMRASSPTSTSSPRMPLRTVNGPDGPWGCEGGKVDTTPVLTKKRTIGKNRIRDALHVSDNGKRGRRSRVELAILLGRHFPAYGGISSSYQPTTKFTTAPTGAPTSSTPGRNFLGPTSVTVSSRTYLDHPDLHQL